MTTKFEMTFLDEDQLRETTYGTYLSGTVEDLDDVSVLAGVAALEGICTLAMSRIRISPFDEDSYGAVAAGVYDDAEDHLVFEGVGPAGEKHHAAFPAPDEDVFGLTPDGIVADLTEVEDQIEALEAVWVTSAGAPITVTDVYRERSPRYKQ
jgi:hypothetical protein